MSEAQSGTVVVAEVFADPTCPWCFVGWRALAQAAGLRPDVALQRVWRPFFLRPDAPPEGLDRASVYAAIEARDPERFSGMRAALAEAAVGVGAEIATDRLPARIPNVRDAHRVIHWAEGQGRGAEAADAILAAYWTDGRDISDPVVLSAAAAAAGLDGSVVRELLASDADVEVIEAMAAQAAQWGVTGVPLTVFNRKAGVAGAERPETFAQAIDAALA